uniref:Uncharacterized protein n=1 Tax=Leersia perrieri TaxID=77586 RepID=A0A0D9WVJ6_9ORYZ
MARAGSGKLSGYAASPCGLRWGCLRVASLLLDRGLLLPEPGLMARGRRCAGVELAGQCWLDAGMGLDVCGGGFLIAG